MSVHPAKNAAKWAPTGPLSDFFFATLGSTAGTEMPELNQLLHWISASDEGRMQVF